MMDNLIPYRGAWITQIDEDTWWGLYEGNTFTAETQTCLCEKLSKLMEADTIKMPSDELADGRTVLSPSGEENNPAWIVQIRLADNEYDDNFDNQNIKEIVVYASCVEDATKYSTQVIYKQRNQDPSWEDAEIISIVQE